MAQRYKNKINFQIFLQKNKNKYKKHLEYTKIVVNLYQIIFIKTKIMGRKRLATRRQTMCVTLTVTGFDRMLELADALKDGNMSQTVEMLINDAYISMLANSGCTLAELAEIRSKIDLNDGQE